MSTVSNPASIFSPSQVSTTSSSSSSSTSSTAQAAGANASQQLAAWVRAQVWERWEILNPRKEMGSASTSISVGSTAIDIALPGRERSLEYDDLVAEGLLALSEAIARCRPGSNNGLNAFARHHVMGAISDAAANWRNSPGLKMESRIQRFIRSHPYSSAEELQQKFPSYSISELEDELERAKNVWQQISYVENVDDPDETNEAYKEFKRTEAATVGIHVGGAAWGYGCGPQAQWFRDAAAGYRWLAKGTEDRNVLPWPKRGNKRVFRSIWNDRVEADFNKRADHRLKIMGRQGYADWQINRQTTCPPFQIRQGELQQIQHDPVSFKSDKPDYWDARAPMVSVILAVDGKPVTQRTRSKAWFAANYPRFRKTEIDIITDDPVTSCLQMEGLYVAEATTLVPSQGSQSTSAELAAASGRGP
jgi:hypothetical protein